MGAAPSSSALLPRITTGENEGALLAYFHFLQTSNPEQFKRYFADLFLTPTSLVTRPGGFYVLYTTFVQKREQLFEYQQAEAMQKASNMPENVEYMLTFIQRFQAMHASLVALRSFDNQWRLALSYAQSRDWYATHMRATPEVSAQLDTLTTMFQNYLLAVTYLFNLSTGLAQILAELEVFGQAYKAVVSSGFNDKKAAKTLWRTAALSPLDRTALDEALAGLVEAPVEAAIFDIINAMIVAWKRFGDLPYASNATLYLTVLHHLYTASPARSAMSVKVSRMLVEQFKRKMQYFDHVSFTPRTAIVLIATHGSIPLTENLTPVTEKVPKNVVMTRIAFALPGDATIPDATTVAVITKQMQQFIQVNPAAVNRPMDFAFLAMRAFAGARPEAMVYLPSEKYVNKQYTRARGEKEMVIRVLHPDTSITDIMSELPGRFTENGDFATNLPALVHYLASQRYNNLIFLDASSAPFTDTPRGFRSKATLELSQDMVQRKLLLGGGR